MRKCHLRKTKVEKLSVLSGNNCLWNTDFATHIRVKQVLKEAHFQSLFSVSYHTRSIKQFRKLWFFMIFHDFFLMFLFLNKKSVTKTFLSFDLSLKESRFTNSKTDRQLLCQKVRQRISVMKTNAGVFVVFKTKHELKCQFSGNTSPLLRFFDIFSDVIFDGW